MDFLGRMQFEIRQRGKRDVAGWWTEYNWFEELKRGSWKKTVSHVQKKAHMEVVDSEKDEGVVSRSVKWKEWIG